MVDRICLLERKALVEVKTLIRALSYLYNGLLALFLIAASGLVLEGGPLSVDIPVLPWTVLARVVFGAAIFGLLSLLLALGGKWRGLYFLWSLAVAAVVLKGYVFSGYRIAPGREPAVVCLAVLSPLALAGAWFRLQDDRERHYRY